MGKVRGTHVLMVMALAAASLVATVPASAQAGDCFGEAITVQAVPGVPTEGTDGDDVILGTAGPDLIRGGAGDDLICGLGGADVIRGNSGRDRIDAGSGPDRVFGGRGRDDISGGTGRDVLVGNSGADAIAGQNGRDQIRGGTGNDSINGGRHADTINGNGGRDTISGGRGGDTINGGNKADQLRGNSGADTLRGGRGSDLLNGGRGPDTCVSGQGAMDDVSCLAGLRLTEVADLGDRAGLVISPPGDDRLFAVEQYHGIRLIKDGMLLETPFLDLSGDVSTGNEQGVLGLAFHPDYADNGRFFVDYTARNGDTRVVEYQVRSSDPDRARKSSARLVIEIEQPHRWHNAGMIAFGPDGYLYVSTGDGGPANDPDGQGQNKNTLLSGLLRLDVDGAAPYEIPADNPFVDADGADELWAYGLRNAWRFSFDEESGRLYTADVGQHILDEINVAPSTLGGVNYGWSAFEGTSCFDRSSGCDSSGIRMPIVNVSHSNGVCSVIGGSVYRGEAIPELDGHYFWSDFCTSPLNTFLYENRTVTDRTSWLSVPSGASAPTGIHDSGLGGDAFVTSLGVDSAGEIYLATLGGTIYRVEPIR